MIKSEKVVKLDPAEAEVTLHCAQCSHRAVWSFQLDHHQKRNHSGTDESKLFIGTEKPELYVCCFCTFSSPYKLDVYEHYVSQHGIGRTDDTNFQNYINSQASLFCEGPKRHSCACCTYSSHSILTFSKHHKSCQVTPKGELNEELKASIGQVGGDIKPQIIFVDGLHAFHCAQCPYQATTEVLLKQHALVHATEKYTRFNCTKCLYRSTFKHDLMSHMLTHDAGEVVDLFNCTICKYRSRTKASLKNHMLNHKASDYAKRFGCTECSFRATTRNMLNVHDMLKHCPRCLAAFNGHNKKKAPKGGWQKYASQHVMLHARQKEINWFCCAQCSHQFEDVKKLNDHMLTAHRATLDDEVNNWFCCPQCHYQSKKRGAVKQHMQTKVSPCSCYYI